MYLQFIYNWISFLLSGFVSNDLWNNIFVDITTLVVEHSLRIGASNNYNDYSFWVCFWILNDYEGNEWTVKLQLNILLYHDEYDKIHILKKVQAYCNYTQFLMEHLLNLQLLILQSIHVSWVNIEKYISHDIIIIRLMSGPLHLSSPTSFSSSLMSRKSATTS